MILIILLFIIHRVCVESLMSNLTTNHHPELPEINDGESCVAGKLYKMSCNTCRCGENDALICTKMACLDVAVMEELKKKKMKHNLRQDSSDQQPRRLYAALPDGDCVPGTIYRKSCNLCFCNDNKKSVCTKELCTHKLSSKLLDDPKYLWSAFNNADIDKLPALPHIATRCVTGKSYKIDCNICMCLENGNLMCTKDLCPTPEGFAKVEAFQNSGKSCKNPFTIPSKCVQCNCTNGKTRCSMMANCKDMKLLVSSESVKNMKMRLDLDKGGCKPMMIYSVHCNKCYCQPDRTLRCTQKTCLTYSETKRLKKQRRYLEQHGL